MATDTTCACSDCSCKVSSETAITKDGKTFCCDACANGHKDHAGCEHGGCNCHG